LDGGLELCLHGASGEVLAAPKALSSSEGYVPALFATLIVTLQGGLVVSIHLRISDKGKYAPVSRPLLFRVKGWREDSVLALVLSVVRPVLNVYLLYIG
jgi:hypothetical protein